MRRRVLLVGAALVVWAVVGFEPAALADPQPPSTAPASPPCSEPPVGACPPGAGGDPAGALSPGQPVAGLGPGILLSAVGQWVASGAAWLLGQVGSALDKTTRPDLAAGWFTAHMKQMAEVCAFLVLPLLLAAVIQAVARQDLAGLLRAVLVRLPLAILLTAVAVQLVQLCLAAVDSLSSTLAQGAGMAAPGFMGQVAQAISLGGGGVPLFVAFVASLLIAVGAFVLWLELVLRAAAIYVAVLFLPLALAGLVWQATWHWSRRLAETLAALVLSKLVIVAVLGLGAGALSGQGGPAGFSGVVAGAAMLLLATFVPFVLLRLIPVVEAGAVLHLEGSLQRAARATHLRPALQAVVGAAVDASPDAAEAAALSYGAGIPMAEGTPLGEVSDWEEHSPPPAPAEGDRLTPPPGPLGSWQAADRAGEAEGEESEVR